MEFFDIKTRLDQRKPHHFNDDKGLKMKIEFSAFGATFRADITGYVAACPQTFDDPGADAEYTIENLAAYIKGNYWIPCQWVLDSSLKDDIEAAAHVAVSDTIQCNRDEARMDRAEAAKAARDGND